MQVPTAAELRAAWRAYRASLPAGRQDPDPRSSEGLRDLLTTEFESVDDVQTRLREVEALLRERGDRRSVFLTVYTEMTANVQRGIEAGGFDDPAWVREYLVTFANWYRDALLGYERGRPDVPRPWQLAFDASTGGDTLLVQDALLGVNAHINYDLPYALRAVGIDPDRGSKRRDHDRINEVLARLVDVVQRALADVYDARGYTDVDRALGSADEDFTLVGLTQARSLAWRNAVLLTDTRSKLVRRLVDARVEAVATGAGHFVLAPTVDPTVLAGLRDVEDGGSVLTDLDSAFQRRRTERAIVVG